MSKIDNEKVYCKGCFYCKIIEVNNCIPISGNPFCQCNYPENIVEKDASDWYSEKSPYKEYKKETHEINVNNDCIWYKKNEQKK